MLDSLAFVDNIDDAQSFLHVLNEAHPSLEFIMELAVENSLPFLGIKIAKIGCSLQTEVYSKPTDRSPVALSKSCGHQIQESAAEYYAL